MNITETIFKEAILITPKVFKDDRGYFLETFNQKLFNERFPGMQFVQDNESFSAKDTLRGLHFQKPPYAQTKLVRCTMGEIYDVIVDVRKGSPTYLKWQGFYLSDENKHQLLVPRGFAHGFLVTSEFAKVQYKVDNYYAPTADAGLKFDDPTINIEWPVSPNTPKNFKLSPKDSVLPMMPVDSGFVFGENF